MSTTHSDFKPVSTKTSFPVRLLRQLVGWMLVLALAALVFAAWANQRREGKWSLRVFDPGWWGVGTSAAVPYVDAAKTAAGTAYEKVWGPGGLVEDGEAWLRRQQEPAPATTSAPTTTPPLAPDAAAAQRAAHETAFRQAETRFTAALADYRAARPVEDRPVDRARLRDAIAGFKQVQADLDQHLPAYQALPDKNLRTLAQSEELDRLNRKMLGSANELAER